jgi:hypothetical protein
MARDAGRCSRASAPAEPRRAPPDGRIRTWNANDQQRQDEERFSRKARLEQLEGAITAWCARFRRPNDPDIERQIGRQGVGRDPSEAAMPHLQFIEDPRDPRAVVRPYKGRWPLLKQGLGLQYGPSKLIVADPKAPGRFSLFEYIRDLGRKTKNEFQPCETTLKK